MAFLFGRLKSRQDELPRIAKDLLIKLFDPVIITRPEEELAKVLAQIKVTLQGTQETANSADAVAALVAAIIQEDLLLYLAKGIHLLPFEARKDTQTIFAYSLRYVPPQMPQGQPQVITYIVNRQPEVITEICKHYEHADSAMTCGSILREALKNESIALIILYDEPGTRFNLAHVNGKEPTSGEGIFWQFFHWIHRGSFEVNTDAFTTFREILTRHKDIAANFLDANFDRFFMQYNDTLIQSPSYVTKRQSIKLLGELLLDRANYNIMMRYVGEGDNLKLCMRLLKSERKMVQYEGFHVFKVFVANPNKSIAVQKLLIMNKDKLLTFLPHFLEERTEDEQFQDEKSFLIHSIKNLPAEPIPMIYEN